MNDATTIAGPSTLQMLLGLYGFLLPLLLYVVWSALALWDIGRRKELATGAIWGWVLAIFAIPVLGAAAYLLAGGSQVSRTLKLATVVGGAAAYAAVLLIGMSIGGIS
jgi:hypothetical protein